MTKACLWIDSITDNNVIEGKTSKSRFLLRGQPLFRCGCFQFFNEKKQRHYFIATFALNEWLKLFCKFDYLMHNINKSFYLLLYMKTTLITTYKLNL